LNSVKTFGNIVCFRNLEKATNESIALFGDKEASGIVLLKAYADYYHGYKDSDKEVRGYESLVKELQEKFPVGERILGEQNQKDFIKLYGAVLRVRNILVTFDEFAARKNDGIAEVKLTQLQFTIEQAGGITLSNARIGVDGDSTRYSCSTATDTVTCSTLADIGVIDDSKTFHLYADISIPVGLQNGSLRLTLNNGGSIVTAGAVSWTDGTTAFTWLPAGSGPIAAGTLYKF
jgi:hypothetical protein